MRCAYEKIGLHIKSRDISEEHIKELTAVPLKKTDVAKEERIVFVKNTIIGFLMEIQWIFKCFQKNNPAVSGKRI